MNAHEDLRGEKGPAERHVVDRGEPAPPPHATSKRRWPGNVPSSRARFPETPPISFGADPRPIEAPMPMTNSEISEVPRDCAAATAGLRPRSTGRRRPGSAGPRCTGATGTRPGPGDGPGDQQRQDPAAWIDACSTPDSRVPRLYPKQGAAPGRAPASAGRRTGRRSRRSDDDGPEPRVERGVPVAGGVRLLGGAAPRRKPVADQRGRDADPAGPGWPGRAAGAVGPGGPAQDGRGAAAFHAGRGMPRTQTGRGPGVRWPSGDRLPAGRGQPASSPPASQQVLKQKYMRRRGARPSREGGCRAVRVTGRRPGGPG